MLGSSPAGVTKWPLGLMVRTGLRFTSVGAGQQSTGLFAPSQAANVEFKSRRGHCGYSIKASTSDCGSENPGSIPGIHPMGRSHSGNCSGSTLRFGRLKANVHWTL